MKRTPIETLLFLNQTAKAQYMQLCGQIEILVRWWLRLVMRRGANRKESMS